MIKTVDRQRVLKALNKAVENTAKKVAKESNPVVVSSTKTLLGSVSVDRNKNSYTVVCRKTNSVLFGDISLYEAAILIAEYHVQNDTVRIKSVLALLSQYDKHRHDMVQYAFCYRKLKRNNEHDRMLIIEDKYNLADEISADIKYRISQFRTLEPEF